MAETMRAIRYHETGEADVLRLEDAPRPEPGDGEILVRVYSAGVNPVDSAIRRGRFGQACSASRRPAPSLQSPTA
jgi:NADPH:quinone reductase-like Zn-dependent oxidoreductase